MKLTRRQRQVVQLLADGLTCPQVAVKLGVSLSTIRAHVQVISGRLPGNQPPIRRIVANADRILAA